MDAEPYGGSDGDQIRLSELGARLRRHKWVIAAGAVLGIVAGLVMTKVTPATYRARTSLQLESFHDIPLVQQPATASAGLPGITVDNYLQNQVKLLQSDTLAQRVAQKLGSEVPVTVRQSRLSRLLVYFGLREPHQVTAEERRLNAVKEALNTHTSLQSQVIELTYDAKDPAVAAKGANVAAGEFIALNREARDNMISESTAWLNNQASELRAKLEASNARIQNYVHSAGLLFAGKDDTLAQSRMRQLEEALVHAEADRAAKQARYETVTESGKLMSDSALGGSIVQLETTLQKARNELSQMRTIYTANHPKLIAAEAQVQEAERALKKAQEEIAARVKNEYTAALGLERKLRDSQAREYQASERQMDQQRRYEIMKAETDTTQHLYEQVLEQLKAVGAASSLRSANVRVIDAATAPPTPYRPNAPLNASVGFALGTLGGVGLALIKAQRRRVGRPGETAVFNLPELGAIPSSHHAWTGYGPRRLPFQRPPEPGLVTWTHDSSLMSESFRATLNSILFSGTTARMHREQRGRVLTLTSFDPMAGKTTVLANLAVASAERKMRVLVIDGDLRRPRIHTLFNMANDWGLADVLAQAQAKEFLETASLEALARPTHISNVWVLPSGPGNASIPSLLYSSTLRTLLQRFRREFDLIYVDSPPLMLYSDARLLGRLSDGLVMVVRANTRSTEELRTAYARLMADQIPVLGTVLNGWEASAHESREYSAYSYRYHSTGRVM
jgi:capsular exopolysaccharide synthesis family protein